MLNDIKKLKLTFTLFLIFLIPHLLFGQYSDQKEYGLNGRIKQMTAFHYDDVKFVNGKWSPMNPENFKYKSITYFNKAGNIDSSKHIVNYEDELFTAKHEYTFENGRKVAAKFYDYDGKHAKNYTIHWKNKRKYVITVKDIYGVTEYISTSKLDKRFREVKVDYKYYKDDKVVNHGKFVSVLDKNQTLIQGDNFNFTEDKKHTNLYYHFELDQFNNIVFTVQINKTDGSVGDLMKRTIEYY